MCKEVFRIVANKNCHFINIILFNLINDQLVQGVRIVRLPLLSSFYIKTQKNYTIIFMSYYSYTFVIYDVARKYLYVNFLSKK